MTIIKTAFTLIFSCVLLFSVAQTEAITFDRVEDFKEINSEFELGEKPYKLINFWATWCGPCVKELPYIEALHDSPYQDSLDILMISLDFEKQIDSKYIPFLEKNDLRSRQILLLDINYNDWIDDVCEDWSGSIPFTVILRKNKESIFIEDEFESTDDILSLIKN